MYGKTSFIPCIFVDLVMKHQTSKLQTIERLTLRIEEGARRIKISGALFIYTSMAARFYKRSCMRGASGCMS
jgi:hypothetical protein